MQDARRNQVEHELLAAHVDRVTGVVSALIPAHDTEVRREQIDDLAFAFVAPLGAQDHEVHVGNRCAMRHRHIAGALLDTTG